MENNAFNRKSFILVVVASLGYFVDIYDLVLFGVVKTDSIKTILPEAIDSERGSIGKMLFNLQMLGMFIGGILWGVLGDKKGRVKVLFGSILLYSLANIANAFVTDIPTYCVIRIIAGIGLAGELGAGITLVSELMPKEKRGYGTMIIVCFGALGAVLAKIVQENGDGLGTVLKSTLGVSLLNWQVAYIVGGVLGLLLLLIRMGTLESGMFHQMNEDGIKRGDLKLIFFNKSNLIKYIQCIVIGIPIWFVIGLLIMNSEDNFGPLLGLSHVKNGYALMYSYIGLAVGDLIAGLLSQLLKSRKKVVMIFLTTTIIVTSLFLFASNQITLETYYLYCFLLGASTGYWAIFVTIAAEQFGTNIRSTAANTIPNFVRGSVNLVMLFFTFLVSNQINDGISALIVGLTFIALAFFSIYKLKETFGKDLNYMEELS